MQVKQGFRAIGYINNNSTYLNDIRRLCGDMVSYQEIDQFVSQQWAQKETACPCWDKDLQPTLSSNGDACYFIINTGYVTQDSGIPIYGGIQYYPAQCIGRRVVERSSHWNREGYFRPVGQSEHRSYAVHLYEGRLVWEHRPGTQSPQWRGAIGGALEKAAG